MMLVYEKATNPLACPKENHRVSTVGVCGCDLGLDLGFVLRVFEFDLAFGNLV